MHRIVCNAALAGLTAMALPAIAADKPSVTINSPTDGAKVTSTAIPVSVSIKNFTVESKYAGMASQPGRGHVHVMVDGADMEHLTNMAYSDHITVSGQGLKPGRHTLAVELASDDHAPASPPAKVTIDYQPTKVEPLPKPLELGQPKVTILSPKNGERVDKKFTLKVATGNFRLSCAEGKDNVAGYGHLHVFVNQAEAAGQAADHMGMAGMKGEMGDKGMQGMAGMAMPGMVDMPCTTAVPLDLSAWKSGEAKIQVMLAKNDHTTINATPASVTVKLK